jgi:ceramide glucosyltransferase
MTETLHAWLGAASVALAAVGCIYAFGATLAVRRFGAGSPAPDAICPAVSILKPLSGVAPGLYADLASFCDQDYPSPVQVLFAVQSPDDEAVAVVERLIAERPGRDLALVVHAPSRAANPKVANLAELERRIRHEVVIIADADIDVPRDYLRRIVAELQMPDVGAVTCLFRGVAHGGFWPSSARWRSTITSCPVYWLG